MKICRWKQKADKHIFSFRRIYSIIMGNTDTKLNFRKAVIQLTTKTQVQCHLYLVWTEILSWRSSKFANMSPVARINKFPIIGILFWHEDILYDNFEYSWYLITRTIGKKYISNWNEFGRIFFQIHILTFKTLQNSTIQTNNHWCSCLRCHMGTCNIYCILYRNIYSTSCWYNRSFDMFKWFTVMCVAIEISFYIKFMWKEILIATHDKL